MDETNQVDDSALIGSRLARDYSYVAGVDVVNDDAEV